MSCYIQEPLSWAVSSIFTMLLCGHWCGLFIQHSPAAGGIWYLQIFCGLVIFDMQGAMMSAPLDSKALSLKSFSEVSLWVGVSQCRVLPSPSPPPKTCLFYFIKCKADICKALWVMNCSGNVCCRRSVLGHQKSVEPRKCWHCSMSSSVTPEQETGLIPLLLLFLLNEMYVKISETSCCFFSLIVISDEQEV